MEIYHRSPFKYIKITCIIDTYQKTLEQVLVGGGGIENGNEHGGAISKMRGVLQ